MSQPETYEEIRRKLEAFDDLLAACEAALDEMAGTPLGETVRDMLRAAEAKAKGEVK